MNNNQKTILLTGSTSGIGRAAAMELVKYSYILILPIRNVTKGESLKKELLGINPNCQIDLFECNFESIESVKSCANLIFEKYELIDVLINNAGIMEPSFRLTNDNIESHFEVNVLSQYIFNTILLPPILNSIQGRIINLSSALHLQGKFEIESNSNGFFSGIGLYSNSNLYRNLLTFKLAQDLQKTKITVNCLHPGVIKTNLGSDSKNLIWNIIKPIFNVFTKPPANGAKTLIHLAISQEGGHNTGKYWANCKIIESSQLSKNMKLAEVLAIKCNKLTGI